MTPERASLLQDAFGYIPNEYNYKTKNGEIHYIKAGEGPALLLLHGANIGLIEWYPNFAELSKHFTVYAFDLPGAGHSTSLDYANQNYEQLYIKPLQSFIDQQLQGNFHGMIAHSFSGWIAMKLAKLYRPKKQILVNPMGFTQRVPKQHLPLTFRPIAKLLSKTVMKPTQKNMEQFTASVCYNKDVHQPFLHAYCSTLSAVKHPFLFINSLTKGRKVHHDLLLSKEDAIDSTDTLLVHGIRDFLIKPSDIELAKELIEPLTLSQFEHSGHVPSMEEASKFNTVTLEFLRKV